MFYWRFHFENEIPVNCLFTQWNEHIYWIWDLEGEVHSIQDLWISCLQECKNNGFFEVGVGGQQFLVGSLKSSFWDEQLPLPEKFVCVGGGDLTSSLYHVATEIYHGMCHLWIIVVPSSIIVGIRIDVTNHSNRFEEQLYLTRKI